MASEPSNMSFKFPFRRTKVGTADDTVPTSATLTSDIFQFPTRLAEDGRTLTTGWIYYLIFRDAVGAEVTDGEALVRTYIQDESDKAWAFAVKDNKVPHRELFRNSWPLIHGNFYFRLQSITGTAVASVEVRLDTF